MSQWIAGFNRWSLRFLLLICAGQAEADLYSRADLERIRDIYGANI